MNPNDQLVYMTAKIEVTTVSGSGSGTGFYFRFLENQESKSHFPTLITNKHVVKDATQIAFCVHLADKEGNPLEGKYQRIAFVPSQISVIEHPDPAVDLCAIPIGPVIAAIEAQGLRTCIVALNSSTCATEELLEELTPIEEVVMIGYPNGFWDSINNMPIIRSGVTATHPKRKYNGKPEFLIDIAAFPGSSGSPVLLYNMGTYLGKSGSMIVGSRVALLGVLYAGFQHQITGEIKVVNVPFGAVPVSVSLMPNNLGVIISVRELSGLERAVREFSQKIPPPKKP